MGYTSKMKTYEEKIQTLFKPFPKRLGLNTIRISRLLQKLGDPHKTTPPIIHVAGTNGKGSVTSFLRSIFEFSNYKVHTYTSPHLINFNERIRINSKLISNNHLNTLLEECEYYNKAEEITFFEITTAAAFLAFSRIESDIILLETGLGGRFDATNVVENKLCSVITPISMDHMNFLGSTIEKIAKKLIGKIPGGKSKIASYAAALFLIKEQTGEYKIDDEEIELQFFDQFEPQLLNQKSFPNESFLKKKALSVFYIYGSQTSPKKSIKTNEPILTSNRQTMRNVHF